MEFSMRSDKLEREAKARRELAKAKRTKDAALAAEQARREKEREAAQMKRRAEADARKEADARALLEEQALTGGLAFTLQGLRPVRLEGSEDDKVTLPEAALVDLNALDAFSRGPVLLRIWAPAAAASDADLPDGSSGSGSGAIAMAVDDDGEGQGGDDKGRSDYHYYTHCGIKEFSARPGTIGLPDKVLLSLLGRSRAWAGQLTGAAADDAAALTGLGTLNLMYVNMPKVRYACLQPLRNSFNAVGPVKECLEENLRNHSTLSVGDLLRVWYRGKAYDLRVQRMKPNSFGCLLYTDVEVDLSMPQEWLDAQAPAAAAAPAAATAGTNANGTTSVAAVVIPSSSGGGNTLGGQGPTSTAAAAALVFGSTSPDAAEEVAPLPDEPPADAADAFQCRVRLPNGAGALTRRFRTGDSVLCLFELAARALEVRRAALQISTRFPARTFHYVAARETGQTLGDAGIAAGSQEQFLVTVLSS